MATALEIVRGISQVLANSYDGALDENGDPIKIGKRRGSKNHRQEGHGWLWVYNCWQSPKD